MLNASAQLLHALAKDQLPRARAERQDRLLAILRSHRPEIMSRMEHAKVSRPLVGRLIRGKRSGGFSTSRGKRSEEETYKGYSWVVRISPGP